MRARRCAAVTGALLAAACAWPLPELAPSLIAEPAPDSVASVLFMIGDAGKADAARDPVLRVLQQDVERWSAALARDSAVQVVFLGDIVYPLGLRVGTSSFEKDSAIAQSQVAMLAGRHARRHGAIGYFVAGNHDWGHAKDAAGIERLHALEQFLDRRRAEGVHVRLQPEAGQPGPSVIDYGSTRLLLFDTAWWLLARNEYLKRRSFQQTRDAIGSADGRTVIVVAHHPFHSASPHGGLVPFWRTMGVRFLLARSGAMLQDLNSETYRELRAAMLDAFRAGRPLLFAGGHDHSLQVIETDSAPEPRFSVVSGSASKTSEVGHVAGMRYRSGAPGYMRIITHRSGRVDLFVVAAPDDDHVRCAGADGEVEQCLAERTAAFRVTYAQRLQ